MMKMRSNIKKQSGTTLVEFALVGWLFIVLLFAAIEGARLMFTWNTVTEATRLGARTAAVCGVNDAVIKTVTQFNDNRILPADFTADAITVNYLDIDGNPVADPSPGNAAGFLQIEFVEVRIDYQYDFLVPFFNNAITLPPFSTVRPREALGIVPQEGFNIC